MSIGISVHTRRLNPSKIKIVKIIIKFKIRKIDLIIKPTNLIKVFIIKSEMYSSALNLSGYSKSSLLHGVKSVNIMVFVEKILNVAHIIFFQKENIYPYPSVKCQRK